MANTARATSGASTVYPTQGLHPKFGFFSTAGGRHGEREREKYRVGASSGNVAVCADNNKAFPPVTAAASHEKPRGFVHHWRMWRFLCAVFCFPLTSFRELMVKESLLGMSSELEGLLTCLPAFLLPSLAW